MPRTVPVSYTHLDVYKRQVLYNPTGTYDYIPLATNAVRQALLVAANLEEPMQKYMGTQATLSLIHI